MFQTYYGHHVSKLSLEINIAGLIVFPLKTRGGPYALKTPLDTCLYMICLTTSVYPEVVYLFCFLHFIIITGAFLKLSCVFLNMIIFM